MEKRFQSLITISIALLLSAKIFLNAFPLSQRQIPVEPDDAYSFIQRAVQLDSCPAQSCQALIDLETQFSADFPDVKSRVLAGHAYHRTFPFIYPLHSILVWTAHGFALSWETSYNLVSLLITIFISISVIALLTSLFDNLAASFAIAALSFYVFPSDLLHSGSPFALSMAFAMLAWSLIFNNRSRIAALIFVILGGLSHPVGALFALVSAILAYKIHANKDTKKRLVAFSAVIALIIIALPLLPLETEFATGIQIGAEKERLFNLSIAGEKLKEFASNIWHWGESYWNLFIVSPVILYGFANLNRQSRKNITYFLLAMVGLIFSSIISSSFLRGFPPDLTERLWLPIAVILVGLIGNAITVLIKEVPSIIRRNQTTSPAKTATMLTIALLFLLAIFDNSKHILRHYQSTLDSRVSRGNFAFDEMQPKIIFCSGSESQTFYSDPIIMHYYLAHGGMAQSAQLTPLANSSSNFIEVIRPEISAYQVLRSPIRNSRYSKQGSLELQNGSTWLIDFSAMRNNPDSFHFFVSTQGDQGSMKFHDEASFPSANWAIEVAVPPDFSDWIEIDISNAKANINTLFVTTEGSTVLLGGLRVNLNQQLLWPWNSGIKMRESIEGVSINFISEELVVFPGFDLKIEADLGDYILGKLTPTQSIQ